MNIEMLMKLFRATDRAHLNRIIVENDLFIEYYEELEEEDE